MEIKIHNKGKQRCYAYQGKRMEVILLEYKKPVMKMSELKKMGFTESFLLYVRNNNNDSVSWRSGEHPNSSILFDTAAFEKIRVAKAKEFRNRRRRIFKDDK